MIKLERAETWGIRHAIRGTRNPMNSWDKSDSGICKGGDDGIECKRCAAEVRCCHAYDNSYQIGKNDMNLLQRLIVSGTDHRKFMRQIMVSVDITAPLYWWKEYDTYKVSTVANSTSTMHKIHSKPFELKDFSHDHMTMGTLMCMQLIVDKLEEIRLRYMEGEKNKSDWYDMIQLLPSSYNQMRTCTLNYETLRNIYFARRNHKLDEWHKFCDWVKLLPFAEELITYEGEKSNVS